MKIEHCESSRVWALVHQPGHPVQTAARLAVKLCLRRRHPDTFERHILKVELIIERLEEAAKHE